MPSYSSSDNSEDDTDPSRLVSVATLMRRAQRGDDEVSQPAPEPQPQSMAGGGGSLSLGSQEKRAEGKTGPVPSA